jgi:hypothetical protein
VGIDIATDMIITMELCGDAGDKTTSKLHGETMRQARSVAAVSCLTNTAETYCASSHMPTQSKLLISLTSLSDSLGFRYRKRSNRNVLMRRPDTTLLDCKFVHRCLCMTSQHSAYWQDLDREHTVWAQFG